MDGNIQKDENRTDLLKEISLISDKDSIAQIERMHENVNKYEYLFSVCLIGNANVGKTSLLTRYCDNVFKEKYSNTIGVDFRIVNLKHKDTFIKLHIWDTAGQERFRSITVNYFRNVHGFFFIFDLSNKESFEKINEWLELAKTYNKNAMINFLVGNKSDNNREVSEKQAIEFAEMKNLIYYETSAKTNENVENSFHYMTYKLIEYYSKNKNLYEIYLKQGNIVKNEDEMKNKSSIPTNQEKKCFC